MQETPQEYANNQYLVQNQMLRFDKPISQLSRTLAKPILDFLIDKYSDQLVPLLLSEQETQYHSLTFDLLEFIFFFPEVGEKFHDHADEFQQFMKTAFRAAQSLIL